MSAPNLNDPAIKARVQISRELLPEFFHDQVEDAKRYHQFRGIEDTEDRLKVVSGSDLNLAQATVRRILDDDNITESHYLWAYSVIEDIVKSDLSAKNAFSFHPTAASTHVSGQPILVSRQVMDILVSRGVTSGPYLYDINEDKNVTSISIDVGRSIITIHPKNGDKITLSLVVGSDQYIEGMRAGLGQSMASLNERGGYTHHSGYSMFEICYTTISFVKDQDPLKNNIAALIGLWLSAAYLGSYRLREYLPNVESHPILKRLPTSSSVLSGPVKVPNLVKLMERFAEGADMKRLKIPPAFDRFARCAARTASSYNDYSQGYIYGPADSIFDQTYSEKGSVEKQLTLARKMGADFEETLIHSYLHMPCIFTNSSIIFTGLSNNFWAQRLGWMISLYRRADSDIGHDYVQMQLDVLHRGLIGGWNWGDTASGDSLLVFDFLYSLKGNRTLMSDLQYGDVLIPTYSVINDADIPMIISLGSAVLPDTVFSGNIDSYISTITTLMKDKAAAISPHFWGTYERLIRQSSEGSETDRLIATNTLTRAACFARRFSIFGFPASDLTFALSKYVTSAVTEHKEKGQVYNQKFVDMYLKYWADVPPSVDNFSSGVALDVMAATSSGPGTGIAFRPDKGFIPESSSFRGGVRDDLAARDIAIKSLNTRQKNVVIPFTFHMLYAWQLLKGLGMSPDDLATGRRDVILKSARLIYLISPVFLMMQSVISKSLKTYENQFSMFANVHNKSGNFFSDQRTTSAVSSMAINSLISNSLVERVLCMFLDFSKYDTHVYMAFVSWLTGLDRGIKGPLADPKLTDEYREIFREIYARAATEGLKFRVSEGDSSRFVIYSKTTTSGDLYTTLHNSFYHMVIWRWLESVFSLYARSTPPTQKDGSWFSAISEKVVVPLTTEDFTVSIDFEKLLVFGDDGIASITVSYSGSNWPKVYSDIIQIARSALSSIGMYTSPGNLRVSYTGANFLNIWMTPGPSRRARNAWTKERPARSKASERCTSALGMLVSGCQVDGYIATVLETAALNRAKTSFGKSVLIPIETSYYPKPDGDYLKSLPFPRDPYAYLSQSMDYMKGIKKILVVDDKTPAEQLAKLVSKSSRIKVKMSGLADREPYPSVDTALAPSEDCFFNRLNRDRLSDVDISTLPKDLAQVSFKGSVKRAVDVNLAIAVQRDRTLSQFVQASAVVDLKEVDAPDVISSFEFGLDNSGVAMRLTLKSSVVGALVLKEGKIYTALYKDGDLLTIGQIKGRGLIAPPFMGICNEYFLLAMIFGFKRTKDAKIRSMMGTGSFSPDPIEGSTLYKIAKSSKLSRREIMRIVGYTDAEIDKNLALWDATKFSLSTGDVKSFESALNPEIPLSSSLLMSYLDILVPDLLNDADPQFLGEMRRMLLETIASRSICDALVIIRAKWFEYKQLNLDVNFIDYILSSSFIVARVFGFTLERQFDG